ncbi:MAG: PKD domain-containing protein [Bacteroidia bacterium]|nr:PKD domain-containing protein [Bacteroidia bacterium]
MLGLSSGWTQPGVNMDRTAIPASPSTFGSVGASTSVSLPTGTLQVGIPLYTVSGYGLSVPISLGYAATGIQVNQPAGNVGLGWGLNTGGFITRIVRDKPDDKNNGYAGYNIYNFTNCWERGTYVEAALNCNTPFPGQPNSGTTQDVDFLENILKGFTGIDPSTGEWNNDAKWDTQPDVYYFNVLGLSGRFVLDANGFPVLTPYQNLKITYNDKGSSPSLTNCGQEIFGWTITDGNGYNYIFEVADVVTQQTQIPAHCNRPASTYSQSYTSTWYLTEIIGPNGDTEIKFNYSASIQPPYSYTQTTKNRYSYVSGARNSCLDGSPNFDIITTITQNTTQSLTAITFPQGRVDFTYGFNRTDLTNGKALSVIEIKDNSPRVIHRINFSYGTFTVAGNANLRALKLQKVKIDNQPDYVFKYYEGSIPPLNSFQIDAWGYYNGNGSTDAIPAFQSSSISYPGANREAVLETTRQGTLQEVIYPTGGLARFEYQLHNYLEGGINKNWGGLRIAKVITFPDPINLNQKYEQVYTYTREEDGQPAQSSGTINNFLYPLQYLQGSHNIQGNRRSNYQVENYVVRSSNPSNYNELNFDAGLVYKYVIESVPTQGKTIHRFTCFEDAASKDVPAQKYELNGQNPRFVIWKTNGSGICLDDSRPQGMNYPPYLPNTSRAWRRGLPIYVKVKAQDNRTLSYTENEYIFESNRPLLIPYPQDQGNWEYRVANGLVVENGGWAYLNGVLTSHNIVYGTYKEESEWIYLTKTIQTTYDEQGVNSASQITEFFYNPKNLQVSEVVNTTIDGRTLISRYKYPVDIVNAGTWLYPFAYESGSYTSPVGPMTNTLWEMMKRGMNTVVIEEQSIEKKGTVEHTLAASLNLYEFPVPADTFERRSVKRQIFHPFNQLSVKTNTSAMILPKNVLQLEIKSPVTNFTPASLNTSGELSYDSCYKPQGLVFKYDTRGRVVEQQVRQTPVTARIYDTQNNVLMAEVVNAQTNEIGYESFESVDQTNDWDYTFTNTIGTPPDPPLSHTGKIGARGIFKRKNLPAGTYRVSLWGRRVGSGTSITIGGQSITLPTSTSRFHYIERQITLSAQGNIEINSNSNLIDEVRIHPADAWMTTQTYEPLVGITSGTDINNQSTYYSFDSQYRPYLVRDKDQNILSETTYNYAPPLVADFTPATCYNTGVSKSFTAQLLSPTGAAPTYTWDFGDGTTATGSSLSKTYSNTGSYQVTLTVSQSGYMSGKVQKTVQVYPPLSAFFDCLSQDGAGVPCGFKADNCFEYPGIQGCSDFKVALNISGGKTPYASIGWYRRVGTSGSFTLVPSLNEKTETDPGFFCGYQNSIYLYCEVRDACGNLFTTPTNTITYQSTSCPF